MNKWYLLNSLLLLYASYKFATSSITSAKIFGLLGLLFIMYNWTRQAIFKSIRDAKERSIKIKFAKLSKRKLPFHKWTGTIALILIIFHGSLILKDYGLLLGNKKLVAGLLAGSVLFLLVASGWIRWMKTTPVRRYVHWGLGFLIFFSVLIHILL